MRYLFLISICLLLAWLNIKSGSTGWMDIGFLDLLSSEEKSLNRLILMDVRIPALIAATCAGAALGLSGLLMQVLFQNALAGPGVMGVSSGASLAISLALLAGVASGIGHALLGVIGSCAVLGIVILASLRMRSHTSLLILGLMLGYIISSLVTILQYGAEADRLQQFVFWTMGGFHSVSWTGLKVMVPGLLVLMMLVALVHARLDVLLLGESQMKSLGYEPKTWRILILALAGGMIGLVTAYCGPLAFLGLAAPHVARMFIRTDLHRHMIPLTVLVSVMISLLALYIVSSPWIGFQLPLNAVLSIFGAPVVIWLLIKSPNTIEES